MYKKWKIQLICIVVAGWGSHFGGAPTVPVPEEGELDNVLSQSQQKWLSFAHDKHLWTLLQSSFFLLPNNMSYVMTFDTKRYPRHHLSIRDSSCMAGMYTQLIAEKDTKTLSPSDLTYLDSVLRGLVLQQAKYIARNPYVSVFPPPSQDEAGYSADEAAGADEAAYGADFALDSLIYFLRLLHQVKGAGIDVWKEQIVHEAVVAIVETIEAELRHDSNSNYGLKSAQWKEHKAELQSFIKSGSLKPPYTSSKARVTELAAKLRDNVKKTKDYMSAMNTALSVLRDTQKAEYSKLPAHVDVKERKRLVPGTQMLPFDQPAPAKAKDRHAAPAPVEESGGARGTYPISDENVGLIWSAYRPSHDKQAFSYSIPANLFAAAELRRISELTHAAGDSWNDTKIEMRAQRLSNTIKDAVHNHGVRFLSSTSIEQIYCYEIDGLGGCEMIDDATMPSLLSIPYFDPNPHNPIYTESIYQATRKFVLSARNPYFYEYARDATAPPSPVLGGIGSPGTPRNWVWPVALIMEALTSQSKDMKRKLVEFARHPHKYGLDSPSSPVVYESINAKACCKEYTMSRSGCFGALFVDLIRRVAESEPESSSLRQAVHNPKIPAGGLNQWQFCAFEDEVCKGLSENDCIRFGSSTTSTSDAWITRKVRTNGEVRCSSAVLGDRPGEMWNTPSNCFKGPANACADAAYVGTPGKRAAQSAPPTAPPREPDHRRRSSNPTPSSRPGAKRVPPTFSRAKAAKPRPAGSGKKNPHQKDL